MSTSTEAPTWDTYFKAQDAVLSAVKADSRMHTDATLTAVHRAEDKVEAIYRVLRGEPTITLPRFRRLAW